MGVPGLFPYIRRRFPRCVRHEKTTDRPRTYDCVLIDANALLHPAAQSVYCYGGGETVIPDPTLTAMTAAEREVAFFDLFFESIIDITRQAIPMKVLYIAIDGVAPVAKQNQQRERRFQSFASEHFNSSSLTPGTAVMWRLRRYMTYRIRLECEGCRCPPSSLNNTFAFGEQGSGCAAGEGMLCPHGSGTWSHIPGLQVIFSPHTTPGEGEHKILDFVRARAAATCAADGGAGKQERVCMVGPDGDLIMLCLSLSLVRNAGSIYLFREDQFVPGWVYTLNISRISRILARDYCTNRFDAVRAFVFVGIFLGNDFAHRLKMFNSLPDGFDALAKIITMPGGRGVISHQPKNRPRVSFAGVRDLINELAKREPDELALQASTFEPISEEFVDRKLLACTGEQNTVDMPAYRRMYYHAILPGGEQEHDPDPHALRVMCRSYIKTLVWVWMYYIYKIPSWDWCYEYHAPPLMCDLAAYMNSIDHFEVHFDAGQPTSMLVQLASVFPGRSADLIEDPLGRKVHEQFPQFFPDTFHIDREGATREYMGVAHLPFVNRDAIRRFVSGRIVDEETTKESRQQHHVRKDLRTDHHLHPTYITFERNSGKPRMRYTSSYGSFWTSIRSKTIGV